MEYVFSGPGVIWLGTRPVIAGSRVEVSDEQMARMAKCVQKMFSVAKPIAQPVAQPAAKVPPKPPKPRKAS